MSVCRCWFWRAIDQYGVVMDEILQPKRYKRAAIKLLRNLLRRFGLIPKRLITDKLSSHGTTKRKVALGLDHRSHKGLNNRAENSHLSFQNGN
ncbi:DDE-type integrase/transposase/recombinase [Ruegeria atlantica]|uniref:DDE domain-containing protein n=1 Tax=Ruegeria atlantica TaxID=81569 RepID=A0A0N7LQB8_9RHOB|nr:DDE-type integrase/transposase/recombinase [Ruegeria atlantica]CUH47580.1 hypothetical protein RUA4292_01751 [Ruegeria atlantica]